jgi:hypothetical protein
MLYAHNLMLRQGPQFRAYVRWLKGEMVRTKPSVEPSFDEPGSFILQIDQGLIGVKLADVEAFLNAPGGADVPLKKISIEAQGTAWKVHGTVHKVVSLPVEIDGTITPEPDGRVKFHVAKIDVLKIPVGKLLHLTIGDMAGKTPMTGVQVSGDDIYFDTEKVLPPPHIRGRITSLNVVGGQVEVVYGGAKDEDGKLAQWHNFLRFRGGTLDFGKLAMRDVDLTLIDATNDQWFDLDLANYQAQMVNGYTRMTAQAGLEIYLPPINPKDPPKVGQAITLEWLKNRNAGLPSGVKVQ